MKQREELINRNQEDRVLRRMNRTLSTMLQIDHALLRLQDEQELLHAVCRVLVDTGCYRLAWVGYAQHDEDKSVKPIAQEGHEEGYLDSIHITWADEPHGRGPTGTAIRTGKSCIARDSLNDPDFAPWRERALKYGYASSIALPLTNDAGIFGALNIYAVEPNAFDVDEVRLLEGLASELSYGIVNLRLRKEHGEIERALSDSQERLEHLLTCSPAVIYSCQATEPYNATYISYNILRSTGYTQEEFLSNPNLWPENLHPDDAARVFSDLKSLFGEGTHIHEYRWKIKDGSYRWFHDEASLNRDVDGEPIDIVGSWIDITDKKTAEQALRQSEGKWRSITQFSPDHILLVDPAGVVQFVNHTVSGQSPEQVVGRSITSCLPDEFKSVAHTCLQRVLSTGVPDRYETEYRDADGNTSYLEAHVGPVKDGDQIVSLIVNVRNITERKKIEEELRQFATVVENTAEGVIVTNADNEIIAVNNAFTEITGYKEEEVLSNNPRFLKSERHDRDFYSSMWAAINSADLWQGEIWDRRKSGEIFPAWSTISAVRDSSGNISNYVSVFSDISMIKRSQEQLDYLAHHDPLTNLPNRLLFNDRLDHAIKRAQRERKMVAVLFLDLDRFKNINDSLGHPIGDDVLQKAATRIIKHIRKEDTVARLGGDEFIVLIEDMADIQDVALLAEKLIREFDKPFLVREHELHLTMSAGISIYPDDGKDSATLVRNADAAMYRAKEEGRNDYQFYTEALTTVVFEHLTLETALRHALENDELVLHYQSQHMIGTGKLVGAEALIRWQHPDMGLVAPAKFIPLAEESGLIESIGKWVLNKACLQMKCWLDNGVPLNRIAVNLSGVQFQRGNIVATVRRALTTSGLDPQRLELEITEGIVMHDTKKVINMLNALKQLGVTVAIDDFGTGYSSLSYLKRLPVDKLKIDRSFVRDITRDPNDEAIARAVVALGQSMQLDVIAEGIETEEQMEFLKSLGCNEAQGYLYSKPVPEAEFTKLLMGLSIKK